MGRNRALPKGIYMPEASRKALCNRLSRIEGQIAAIKRRIVEGECADDLLIQVAAVKGAVTQVAAKILEDHLVDCTNSCMRNKTSLDGVTRRVARALSFVLRQT